MSMMALKPPMGWNSWNTFCWNINEQIVRETADRMLAEGYLEAGYNIISIDDCWMSNERDSDGNLVPDPNAFPNGMKAVGDYLHERGFKFGIYADGGIRTCAGRPGSFGHEKQDAEKFAEWGVDLVKYDFCYPPPGCDGKILFRRMGQALRETGRDIIFSACWSVNGVWKWARSCGAHMWRIAGDIQDSWKSIESVGFGAVGLEPYAGPSGWNDLDMLVIGLNGKGFVGEIGGGSEINEYQVHFALWCMLNSPLLMGHDLRSTSDEIKNILLNKEMIAINQDDAVIPAFKIENAESGAEVFAKPLANGDIAFCLINRNDSPKLMAITWDQCGWEIGDSVTLRDLINHEDLGAFKTSFYKRVPARSCEVFRAKRI